MASNQYNSFSRLLYVAPLIAMVGCVATQQTPRQEEVAFQSAEHRSFITKGANTIKGQAFLRQQGGGVITCAGNEVIVIPQTVFFHQAIGRANSALEIGRGMPSDAQGLIRRTRCDAQGNFSVADLPDGSWYVVTDVRWFVGYNQQGGKLVQAIDNLRGATTTQALLTGENR